MENHIKKLLLDKNKFELERFHDININETHKPYTGIPRKHPTDKNVLVLLTDPFSQKQVFYEFSMESIGLIEETGTVTSENGESAMKIRVWIKKGMMALKSESFVVE